MTPYGDVLREGETPYEHNGNPYTLRFYSMFDGEPHSLVEDLIDRQKVVNRNLVMNDRVINTSAKNPLFTERNTKLLQLPFEKSSAKICRIRTKPLSLSPQNTWWS